MKYSRIAVHIHCWGELQHVLSLNALAITNRQKIFLQMMRQILSWWRSPILVLLIPT